MAQTGAAIISIVIAGVVLVLLGLPLLRRKRGEEWHMGAHSSVALAEKPAKQRSTRDILIPVVLVLAGILVFLYPVVSSQWNNYRQMLVAEEYSRLEKTAPPEIIDRKFEEALAYNDQLGTAALADPWSGMTDEGTEEYQNYLAQLDTFDAMARIVIPSVHINLPVYHGTSAEALQKGAGHLFGTDLPVGGSGRHSVITGHTGLPNATLFDNLIDVKDGDAIYIQASGQKMKYVVRSHEVVLPEQVDSLRRVPGADLVTLITCTPYGINTHRLLLHAERVPMDREEERVFDESGFHWQWWMKALLAACIIIALLLARWIWKMRKTAGSEAA